MKYTENTGKYCIIDWNAGLKEYEQIGEKQSFFASPSFLKETKDEIISVTGYSLKLPRIWKYRFISFRDRHKKAIIPVQIVHRNISILCDLSIQADYSVGFNNTNPHQILSVLKGLFKYLKQNGYKKIQVPHANNWSKELIEKDFKAAVSVSDAVSIQIAGGYTEWKNNLSKSVRQNIRTAYNRINTDQKTLKVEHYIGKLSRGNLFRQCYLHRYRNIERRTGRCPCYYLPMIVTLSFLDTFNRWNSTILKNPGSYSCMCFINGKLAAYASGVIHNRTFIIPFLSYNPKFKRYDPGKILIEKSIEYLCDQNLADYFDLYRGSEPYKYAMGGG